MTEKEYDILWNIPGRPIDQEDAAEVWRRILSKDGWIGLDPALFAEGFALGVEGDDLESLEAVINGGAKFLGFKVAQAIKAEDLLDGMENFLIKEEDLHEKHRRRLAEYNNCADHYRRENNFRQAEVERIRSQLKICQQEEEKYKSEGNYYEAVKQFLEQEYWQNCLEWAEDYRDKVRIKGNELLKSFGYIFANQA